MDKFKELLHQSYFVLVALESDHMYRWIAGVLFLIGIVSYLYHHFKKREGHHE